MGRRKADHRPHSQAIDGFRVIPDPPIDLRWISFPFLPASSFIIYPETVHPLNVPVELAWIDPLWLQLSSLPKDPRVSAANSTSGPLW